MLSTVYIPMKPIRVNQAFPEDTCSNMPACVVNIVSSSQHALGSIHETGDRRGADPVWSVWVHGMQALFTPYLRHLM